MFVECAFSSCKYIFHFGFTSRNDTHPFSERQLSNRIAMFRIWIEPLNKSVKTEIGFHFIKMNRWECKRIFLLSFHLAFNGLRQWFLLFNFRTHIPNTAALKRKKKLHKNHILYFFICLFVWLTFYAFQQWIACAKCRCDLDDSKGRCVRCIGVSVARSTEHSTSIINTSHKIRWLGTFIFRQFSSQQCQVLIARTRYPIAICHSMEDETFESPTIFLASFAIKYSHNFHKFFRIRFCFELQQTAATAIFIFHFTFAISIAFT